MVQSFNPPGPKVIDLSVFHCTFNIHEKKCWNTRKLCWPERVWVCWRRKIQLTFFSFLLLPSRWNSSRVWPPLFFLIWMGNKLTLFPPPLPPPFLLVRLKDLFLLLLFFFFSFLFFFFFFVKVSPFLCAQLLSESFFQWKCLERPFSTGEDFLS